MKADWFNARIKVAKEGHCRACGTSMRKIKLDAAHTLNRSTQDEYIEGQRYVPPDAIVPLCYVCHFLYDDRKISLIGRLKMPELRNALKHYSKARVRRRLSATRGS